MNQIFEENQHHIDAIQKIVDDSGEHFENNLFPASPNTSTTNRQLNLFSLAKIGNRVLDVGFDAGQTTLLFLISNPIIRMHCFDNCKNKYTQKCYEYLSKHFSDRLILHKGNPVDTISTFSQTYANITFDVLNINGDHTDFRLANLNFFTCKDVAHSGSIIIWENIHLEHISSLWTGYIRDKFVEEFRLLSASHVLGRVN